MDQNHSISIETAQLTTVETSVLLRKYYNDQVALRNNLKELKAENVKKQLSITSLETENQFLKDTLCAIINQLDNDFRLKVQADTNILDQNMYAATQYIDTIALQSSKICEQNQIIQELSLEVEELTNSRNSDSLNIKNSVIQNIFDAEKQSGQSNLNVNSIIQAIICE
ncbi:hypothetical protein SS50377_24653 [Spironucleus salmonicida]|uniref:Uncharacterized protein n=1 Tax=Spironucleus salmonicida TaxID=348837 RepID=V6LIP1_9EUKA|nr:hypothetical protein SS50377_24653 [Spironucleus salmonicida]|eukprot:EST44465.1 Hypothetical protein SS50377_15459 [Spironucleus salmonicida]